MYGPGLLFLMAVAETSFLTGVVVPAGVATSVATMLAASGVLSFEVVALAALAGGAVGDSLGFWVGRVGGARLLPRKGRLGDVVQRAHREGSRFFGRHPAYSVTMARLVPFVRTFMPMAAGMGGLGYGRFLVWEIVGVAGWATMYMTLGAMAGHSLELVLSAVGWGWTAVFAVTGLIMWVMARRRRGDPGARAPDPVPEPPALRDGEG